MEEQKRWLVCRIIESALKEEVPDSPVLAIKGDFDTEEQANRYAREIGGAYVIPSFYARCSYNNGF